jgi:putative (di)nucleoside polyphosphate hydrolase
VSRVVSCGAVLVDRRGQLFVCHATGSPRWDLPKGLADVAEPARDAAVREAWEESGLRLDPRTLHDLGEFDYLSGKRLHLFALRVADNAFDIRGCSCRSFFEHHRTGRRTPETDAWAWKPRLTAREWCGKNMTRVLSSLDWAAIDGLPEVDKIDVDRAVDSSL